MAGCDVFLSSVHSRAQRTPAELLFTNVGAVGTQGQAYVSFLTRDLWMMTTCPACMDVLHFQRLHGELPVNSAFPDSVHAGWLRFTVTKEASAQDGVAAERRGPPICFYASLLNAWAKKKTKPCSERPHLESVCRYVMYVGVLLFLPSSSLF